MPHNISQHEKKSSLGTGVTVNAPSFDSKLIGTAKQGSAIDLAQGTEDGAGSCAGRAENRVRVMAGCARGYGRSMVLVYTWNHGHIFRAIMLEEFFIALKTRTPFLVEGREVPFLPVAFCYNPRHTRLEQNRPNKVCVSFRDHSALLDCMHRIKC